MAIKTEIVLHGVRAGLGSSIKIVTEQGKARGTVSRRGRLLAVNTGMLFMAMAAVADGVAGYTAAVHAA
jgi:hypothetical protein